jgi:hypothetical protein
MYSGLFVGNNFSPNPGLLFSCYNGYMGNTGVPVPNPLDNVNYFSNAPPLAANKIATGKQIYGTVNSIPDINTGTNSCISDLNEISVQWLGYFKPNVTSTTWQFRTTSDDCSYLWIGDNAITGFTIANSNINNGGIHGDLTVTSTSLSLTQGVYYPLRIQYGQNSGSKSMRLEYSSNGGFTWLSDGTNLYFH